mgnify:CR=1 FL=1
MNTVEKLEQEQIEKLVAERPVPQFRPGDTLRVHVKVVEGTRERIRHASIISKLSGRVSSVGRSFITCANCVVRRHVSASVGKTVTAGKLLARNSGHGTYGRPGFW